MRPQYLFTLIRAVHWLLNRARNARTECPFDGHAAAIAEINPLRVAYAVGAMPQGASRNYQELLAAFAKRPRKRGRHEPLCMEEKQRLRRFDLYLHRVQADACRILNVDPQLSAIDVHIRICEAMDTRLYLARTTLNLHRGVCQATFSCDCRTLLDPRRPAEIRLDELLQLQRAVRYLPCGECTLVA